MVNIGDGFDASERGQVARLFWEAFRGKLEPVMAPEARALAFIDHVADPDRAICARAADGTLVGLAGYKTGGGALVGGNFADMRDVYGFFGALWRGLALSALERKVAPDALLMDGICVDATARGQGVGGRLLDAVIAKARTLGCKTVRLDVIDTNPRARALYERKGFRSVKTESTGLLRHVFGFRSAATMHFALE